MRRLNLDLPKQPRNREVRACLPCRNGKIKCDQAKPRCQKCIANNRNCVYVSKIQEPIKSTEDIQNRPSLAATGPLLQGDGLYQDWSPKHSSRAKLYDQTTLPGQVGFLTAGDDAQVRYYESSSWVGALRDLEGSQLSLSPPTSNADSPDSLYSLGAISQTSSESPVGEIYEFVNLPEVNRLICWYSEFVQFWHPIADGPSVVAALRCIRNRKPCPAGSSALLAAICYSASSSLHTSTEVESSSFDPSAWRELAQQLLSSSQYPQRPNLNTIRAAFLLAAPSMAEWHIDPDPAPISVLVRAAQSLGLHRDPVSFHSTPREAESRRILWWCIQSLDVGYSFAHALPPLIHSTSSDVKMIPGKRRLETKLLETQIRSNRLFTKMAEEMYSVHKPTQDSFQRLTQDVDDVYNYTMDEIKQCEATNPSDLERFIMLCQRLHCYKLVFLLHQPYLRSSRWPPDSRRLALGASKSYVQEFLVGMDDPSFAPYQWLLHHYNIYHPCAIILQDLIQFPYSNESSELLAVVDPTIHRFTQQQILRPCPPCKKLCLLLNKACESNQWTAISGTIDTGVFDSVIDDWDPIFSYCGWDDKYPPVIQGSGPLLGSVT